MKRDRNDIESTLTGWLSELRSITKSDNVISEDEQALVNIVQEDFQNLQSKLFEVLDSDISDSTFSKISTDFLNDLVYKLIRSAKKDNVINFEELNLINAIDEFANRE